MQLKSPLYVGLSRPLTLGKPSLLLLSSNHNRKFLVAFFVDGYGLETNLPFLPTRYTGPRPRSFISSKFKKAFVQDGWVPWARSFKAVKYYSSTCMIAARTSATSSGFGQSVSRPVCSIRYCGSTSHLLH